MMTEDMDDVVLEMFRAINRDGFDDVEFRVSTVPDRIERDLAPWETALVEGLADAVRYAQSVRNGQSRLRVQFKPCESATWEWERGASVDGEFRETVLRGVNNLLDGDKGIGGGELR